MPAHLPGQHRFGLFHLRLQQRVARLPHDRPAAVLLDLVEKPLRAFDLGDDRGAWAAFENIPGEKNQKLVAPEDISLFIDGADAVGVAVVSDPEIRLFRFDLFDQHL